MKILFVHGVHPDDKIGGAELQSWLLSREIGKHNQVTFLAVRSDVDEDQSMDQDGVRVIKLAKKKKFSWREYRAIYLAVKQISPDIIHMRMFDYVLPFACISWLCRIPVVYHISHNFNCRLIRFRKLSKVFAQLRHTMNYLSTRMLAGLICQTNDQKSLLGPSKQPLVVISNSAAPMTGKSFEKDEMLILWVGNIKPVKQPLIFTGLAAFFESSPFKFLMIGYPQDSGLAKKVQVEADRLSNLEYIPGIPFKQTDEFFHRASVFVSTSEEEGYPNTFIQAIQAATPIVSLRVDPDETVRSYQVGYCSQDIDELRHDVKSLMVDRTQLEKMRQNTERCLNERFSIARNGEALDNFLQQLTVKTA